MGYGYINSSSMMATAVQPENMGEEVWTETDRRIGHIDNFLRQ